MIAIGARESGVWRGRKGRKSGALPRGPLCPRSWLLPRLTAATAYLQPLLPSSEAARKVAFPSPLGRPPVSFRKEKEARAPLSISETRKSGALSCLSGGESAQSAIPPSRDGSMPPPLEQQPRAQRCRERSRRCCCWRLRHWPPAFAGGLRGGTFPTPLASR